MTPACTHLDELAHVQFQTEPLTPEATRKLAVVAIVLLRDYLAKEGWTVVKRKGSLTLNSNQVVIKLFVDPDLKLRTRLRGALYPQLSTVVLGVELNRLEPVLREAARDYLKRAFGQGYRDPRDHDFPVKVGIQPVTHDHVYDVAWFIKGTCVEEISEEEIDAFLGSAQADEAEV